MEVLVLRAANPDVGGDKSVVEMLCGSLETYDAILELEVANSVGVVTVRLGIEALGSGMLIPSIDPGKESA